MHNCMSSIESPTRGPPFVNACFKMSNNVPAEIKDIARLLDFPFGDITRLSYMGTSWKHSGHNKTVFRYNQYINTLFSSNIEKFTFRAFFLSPSSLKIYPPPC